MTFPIYGKKNHVPNHQSVMRCTNYCYSYDGVRNPTQSAWYIYTTSPWWVRQPISIENKDDWNDQLDMSGVKWRIGIQLVGSIVKKQKKNMRKKKKQKKDVNMFQPYIATPQYVSSSMACSAPAPLKVPLSPIPMSTSSLISNLSKRWINHQFAWSNLVNKSICSCS